MILLPRQLYLGIKKMKIILMCFPWQNLMEQYFSRIRRLSQSLELNLRIRFMLQDVLDLREAGWRPRKIAQQDGPLTITEVGSVCQKPPVYLFLWFNKGNHLVYILLFILHFLYIFILHYLYYFEARWPSHHHRGESCSQMPSVGQNLYFYDCKLIRENIYILFILHFLSNLGNKNLNELLSRW